MASSDGQWRNRRDVVCSVSAVQRPFRQVVVRAPPAGFEPAHMDPEAAYLRDAFVSVTCIDAPGLTLLAASNPHMFRIMDIPLPSACSGRR